MVKLVRWELDRFHGFPSPEPRTISAIGTTTRRGGLSAGGCALRDQVLDGDSRPTHVVEQDDVCIELYRRSVDENDLRSRAELGQHVLMVVTRGHDQRAVDSPRAK